MKRKSTAIQYWFAALALSTVISLAPARAQSPTIPTDRDADLTRQQLAAFDQFLDNHPEIADQLRKDPSLVNNEEFVENHADLQRYLQEHPEVREDLSQNPNAVMHQEQRFDRREDRDEDRDRDRDRIGDRDITRGELANMDRFMDGHPEIAEQLRKNPALINNKEFVEDHPALREFLASHPGVREEIKENPNAFMNREERFDQREDMRNRNLGNDRDITPGELANMDRFMDSHPEIAEQLRKNPALINNKEFVEDHPALREFLASHPGVREEIKENPNAFMNREERFDQREDMRNRNLGPDRDITRGELANMDRFMDSHPEIAEQLRKDPDLINNKEFVEDHPALREFLASHPGVREEIKENPNAFMNREERFDQREDMRNRNLGPDRDVTRGELANMDRFMDSHPEIAEQLRKDPSLVDNKEFIENHPAFREFLASHPGVREEYRENPTAFMRQEERFDRQQDSNFMHRDRDVTRGELSSFHEFLEAHNNISGELSKNPALATNQEYLENHPALRDYLKSNPKVHEELGENPQSFVKSAQQFEATTKATPAKKVTTKPTAEPKVK